MDNMEKIRRESAGGENFDGTKTGLGITGMILGTALVIIVLALIAIFVL